MKYFRILAPDIAIDMGSANTLVARIDKGIILREPTVVALDLDKKEVITVGQAAKDLIGKSPDNVIAIRPLRDGVISDFELTQALLEYYIRKASPGISMVAPRVAISIPSGATDVEQRALQDAVLQSGSRDVILIEEPVASAYGARLIDPDRPSQAALIVDLGAGTAESAIVTGYGVITSEILRKGGENLDGRIKNKLKESYDLIIGDNTAENIKNGIASFRKDKQTTAMEVGGRDALSGMPRSVDIYASDVYDELTAYADDLIDTIRRTVEKTPPEVASDVISRGIHLTGGLALLDGIGEYLQETLLMPVHVSKAPAEDAIQGSLMIMKKLDKDLKGKKNDSI
ncbi:rod shape-determining protein [Kallipyga gabonensis]|uniref:rod shape-determining protein n=1 Tax=Kallipyga gabonensis TaxID=1686287 RepID=UPI0006B4603D|nr:rod shape-determining protein [Kallipyga gabonensis]